MPPKPQPKSVGAKLLKSNPPPKRSEPLWKGPEVDGITQSMLSRFLNCRERFRVAYILGLKPHETFNHRIEYGQMWHVCEEAFAGEAPNGKVNISGLSGTWGKALDEYVQKLLKENPMSREQVVHWYNVCKVQFLHYVEHWKKHPDVKARTPLLQEQVFDVPYKLPSGRIVRLRGKWDSVDLIGKGNTAGIWLQENKTKSEIDVQGLQRQLKFDLQVMIYLVALQWELEDGIYLDGSGKHPIRGVRYNVVRRPLSGGKGTIKPHKPSKSNPKGESQEEFYERLSGIIGEDRESYFQRFNVEISPTDIANFRRRFLDPILEQLCDWWEYINTVDFKADSLWTGRTNREPNRIHWQHPFGAVNWIDETGHSDLDAYLETGSTVGLTKRDKLFGELE